MMVTTWHGGTAPSAHTGYTTTQTNPDTASMNCDVPCVCDLQEGQTVRNY